LDSENQAGSFLLLKYYQKIVKTQESVHIFFAGVLRWVRHFCLTCLPLFVYSSLDSVMINPFAISPALHYYSSSKRLRGDVSSVEDCGFLLDGMTKNYTL
jgi:hypothetical protein